MRAPTRIIGIDPGTRSTGYGILDTDGFRHVYVTSGFIAVEAGEMSRRLGKIFTEVAALIDEWKPDALAIEQAFVNRNADSALKLGQARGAVICAGVQAELSVDEYTPRTIKKAVVGSGAADKNQIQQMMQRLLGLKVKPQSDEADALAIAMCHANHMNIRAAGSIRGSRRGRWV